MKIEARVGDAAAISLSGITSLTIDGVEYRAGMPPLIDNPPPAPTPRGGIGKMSPAYFTGDDLGRAVLAVRPDYEVFGDGKHLDGSGVMQPPMLYQSAAKPPDGDGETMLLANTDHPYFSNFGYAKPHVDTMVAAAPEVKKAMASIDAKPGAAVVDPRKAWESGPSTLDPASMSFLIMYIGPGGEKALKMAENYRIWYYKTYPTGQASDTWNGVGERPPMNREGLTPEQIEAVRSIVLQ